ncbi:YcnI family protein [Streptomyces sp. NBC_01498]|uniref:DUF1775 domain-containing protein n=1 Tax=Streptomyces sp. NBC_01498 TaxID=2975870 RepID=UPI002E7BAC73|nr:DUF1775 domain-containing protein [Streptomyces sp. NBC_01498]WTL26171.1 YcnI family protein [Streptomyces sp. NBC_01498]
MNASRFSTVGRRFGVLAVATISTIATGTGQAAAHAEVTASDSRALAENVTLSFVSEAESDTSGIKELRIVLPKGITPDTVALKEAPKGWKLLATADGYTVGGAALTAGTDAEHSISVRQLPDAKSLAFKTVETYGDGKISRWIEVPGEGQQVENPAPVLELKEAAPGAEPIAASPTPEPSTGAPSSAASGPSDEATASASSEAGAKDEGSGGGGALRTVIAVVVVMAAGAAIWWVRRSRRSV